MADSTGTLSLKGTAPVGEWKKRVQAARAQIHAHDEAQRRLRAAAKTKRKMAIAAAVIAGGAVAFWIVPLGVVLAIAGAIAAGLIIKPPAPNLIGEERLQFVREVIDALGDIAPQAVLTLAAQLDARRGVPQLALPSGSDDARVTKDQTDAWLSGALAPVPGLKLSWQVTEWRTVTLVRKKVVRRKIKIKTKAKYALATRLAVRLEADCTLFAPKAVVNPPRATDGDSRVEVRERPGGWSLRGRRDSVLKTPLWTVDVAEGLATLREQGKAEYFGQSAAALLTLMKLCESRLAPATAKGGVP